MPSTVKYNGKSPAERIADRLKNSGSGLGADHTIQLGEGPNRTFTNIHHGASQHGANRLGRDDDGEC